jgi:outer membrane protein
MNESTARTPKERQRIAWAAVVTMCAVATAAPLGAQAPASPLPVPGRPSITLDEAVRLARENYPAVREQRARVEAAQQGIAVARTAYLPRVDALWQENRATHNNVFGLLLPQGMIPAVSGPVLPQTSDSVWGSAVGALVSWDALDFGLRRANVDVALAQQAAVAARSAATELDAGAAAADAYLTVLAADAGVGAAQANVNRLQVFANAVRTLAANQLRPGADQSRAEAELALARNQLIQAHATADVARATLAAAIGGPATAVDVIAGRLGDLPAPETVPAPADMHPALRAAAASIDMVTAREKVLERSALPRIALQTAASARGSGAALTGIGGSNGLWPTVSNWAAGVSVSFPVMDLWSVRPRRRVEAQNELAERAAYQQTLLNLSTQQVRAAALYQASVAVAENMTAVLSAARETEQRARVRYDNALATITEIAEAQRLLAQAETDAAVARLGVWRALLAQAQAAGDLTPFLNQLRTP